MIKTFKNKLYLIDKPFHQYNVNPNIFIKIEKPEAAYALGLLWADGSVLTQKRNQRIALGTTYPDAIYFKQIFDQLGEWNYQDYIHKNKRYKKVCHFVTSNRPLAKYLTEKGYKSKSTGSADKIIETIPNQFKHYFFLGLLDGDGCIFINKNQQIRRVDFSSEYNQDWSFMIKICETLKINFKIYRRITKREGWKSSRFVITGRNNIFTFCDYIYQNRENDGIGLSRKYEKYLRIKNSYSPIFGADNLRISKRLD